MSQIIEPRLTQAQVNRMLRKMDSGAGDPLPSLRGYLKTLKRRIEILQLRADKTQAKIDLIESMRL